MWQQGEPLFDGKKVYSSSYYEGEAEDLSEQGLTVIPLKPKSKVPAINSWSEFQEKSPSEEEIHTWFHNNQNNIAIITGREVVVVDADNQEAIDYIESKITRTPWKVKTSQGKHYYYAINPNLEIKNSSSRGKIKIDIRGKGGYVLAPPSIHPSGKVYEWDIDTRWQAYSIHDLPCLTEQDIKLLTNPGSNLDSQKSSLNIDLSNVKLPEDGSRIIHDGEGRESAGISLAGKLVKAGLDKEIIYEFLSGWNQAKLIPPKSDADVRRWINSAFKMEAKNYPEGREKIEEQPTVGDLLAFDLGDFLSIRFPEPETMLSPWLTTQSLSLLFAARGVGKTHVSLGIAYAVASGGTFLKWSANKPRGVLFIDGEMPAVKLQQRLQQIEESYQKKKEAPLIIVNPDSQKAGMPDLSTVEGQLKLEPLITDDIKLIIVDNLSSLSRTGKENEAESWQPLQNWALDLRSKGKSVLFVHHAGKNDNNQRGTSRREDVLDCVIKLKRPDDCPSEEGADFEVSFTKHRNFYGKEAQPFRASLNTDDTGFQTWKVSDIEDDYHKTISLYKENLSQAVIAEMLNKSKSAISKYISKAKSEGLIVEENTNERLGTRKNDGRKTSKRVSRKQ